MENLLLDHFKVGMRFSEYETHFEQEAGQEDPEDKLAYFSKLNWSRHQRVFKKTELHHDFAQFKSNLNAIIITESWCGDAAQSVPVLASICQAANVDLRFILRDTHSDLIDNYLTNGGKSIPILIIFDETGAEKMVWGPRPADAQEKVEAYKLDDSISYEDLQKDLQKWYNTNKSVDIQNEVYARMVEHL